MVRKSLVLLLAWSLSDCVLAQDSQLFRVNVSTSVVINALNTTQVIPHPMTAENIDFFDSQWFVEVNSPAGAMASFTAEPFTNSTHTDHRRDVHLRLRRLRNVQSATWDFDDQADRSRMSNGKVRAVVTMGTDTAGAANVSLRVRFLTGPNPESLAAGNYLTTVVGTITAN